MSKKQTYLYDGEVFEHEGHRFRVTMEHDTDMPAPWEDDVGRGPVSEWRSIDTKRPGERVLCKDGRSCRFYDFAEAMKIAKRDGWGLGPERMAELTEKLGRTPTKGEIREAAVEFDFDFLRAWCNDEWQYQWVKVVLLDDDDNETEYEDSLGGVEGYDDKYPTGVAYELADNALNAKRRDDEAAAKESSEARYWAERDVVTEG